MFTKVEVQCEPSNSFIIKEQFGKRELSEKVASLGYLKNGWVRLGIISDCFDKRNEFCLILPFTKCKFDNMNSLFFLKYTQLSNHIFFPNTKNFRSILYEQNLKTRPTSLCELSNFLHKHFTFLPFYTWNF